MKCKIATTTLLSSAIALFCLTAAAASQSTQQGSCSDATVAGKFGYTSNGSLIGIGPVAAAGIVAFDGKGKLSGHQTRSVNGDVADETFQGAYQVNSDCTMNELIEVYESGQLVRTSTVLVIIQDNGNSGSAIFTKIALPDGTVLPSALTLDAKRLFPRDED